MLVRARSNTDKEYPCTLCGTLGNIVRESDNEEERRIKCLAPRCGYVYSAADSLAAKEAGAIPDGPSIQNEPVAETSDKEPVEAGRTGTPSSSQVDSTSRFSTTTKAPRTPSFVILSKDRTESEFCTKKSLKTRIISWTAQDKKFDVFELSSRKVEAKLSIE